MTGGMQAAVLLCQSAWGPRWFVPKRFLPAKYDYHRPVVPREVAEGVLDSSAGPTDVETGDGGVLDAAYVFGQTCLYAGHLFVLRILKIQHMCMRAVIILHLVLFMLFGTCPQRGDDQNC